MIVGSAGNWRFSFAKQVNISLLILFIFLSLKTYSQNSKDSIPDGTEGEMFAAPTKDSTKMSWNEKRWRLFNGRLTTFKLGAGFLYEYAAFAQDRNSKIQMDSLGTPLKNQ